MLCAIFFAIQKNIVHGKKSLNIAFVSVQSLKLVHQYVTNGLVKPAFFPRNLSCKLLNIWIIIELFQVEIPTERMLLSCTKVQQGYAAHERNQATSRTQCLLKKHNLTG